MKEETPSEKARNNSKEKWRKRGCFVAVILGIPVEVSYLVNIYSTKFLQNSHWTAQLLLILTTVKGTQKAETLLKCCMCFMSTWGRYILSKWNWQWKGEKMLYNSYRWHYVLDQTWLDSLVVFNQTSYQNDKWCSFCLSVVIFMVDRMEVVCPKWPFAQYFNMTPSGMNKI